MATGEEMKLKQVIDPTLAKAFTHPLRGHVWVTVCEKGIASPKEVAEETGLDLSEVSYHFRGLKRRKLIKLVRTEGRRGFAEHFYEPAAPVLYFDDAEWMSLPAEVRSTFSADTLRQVIEELRAAVESGSFEARNRHLSRTWLVVDEQGWEEATSVVEEALQRILAIQRECGERLRGGGETGVPICVAMASFETADGIGRRDRESAEAS